MHVKCQNDLILIITQKVSSLKVIRIKELYSLQVTRSNENIKQKIKIILREVFAFSKINFTAFWVNIFYYTLLFCTNLSSSLYF